MNKVIVIAGCALALIASPVAAKEKRHVRHAKAAPVATKFFQQAPARMIEIAPGRWVSSYGCVTDEGYGRFSPCDLNDGNR